MELEASQCLLPPYRPKSAKVQPINPIFTYLPNRCQIQVWFYEQVNMYMEGYIIGFNDGSCHI
uniref:Uncharacterized protein n=1 Tax=Felis catus TaxID=9685 RepID=A0ABI7WKK2_FELCA